MVSRRLEVAQSLSGVVFAAFLLLHLLNQMSAVLGASAYDRVQGTLRSGYQIPPVEIALILLPLGIHMGIAVVTMLRRSRKDRPVMTLPARLHRWSGRLLLLIVVGHAAATRLPAVLDGVVPDFAGVAFTFRWVPLWYWPYYSLLALAGWYHLLYGLAMALPQIGLRRASWLLAPRRWGTVFVVGAVALLAAVICFGSTDESVMESETARWWLGHT
jgi:succinate dehydrogenase/fumarate reductase cytochrome b subunit